jgi:hypothetical protein
MEDKAVSKVRAFTNRDIVTNDAILNYGAGSNCYPAAERTLP